MLLWPAVPFDFGFALRLLFPPRSARSAIGGPLVKFRTRPRESPVRGELDLESLQGLEHQRTALIADAAASPVSHCSLTNARGRRRLRDAAITFDQKFEVVQVSAHGPLYHAPRRPTQSTINPTADIHSPRVVIDRVTTGHIKWVYSHRDSGVGCTRSRVPRCPDKQPLAHTTTGEDTPARTPDSRPRSGRGRYQRPNGFSFRGRTLP